MTTRPLLSIGIIFKNEVRCIERCLKSLEPLRQAIPCELIMADTGAEDGSREIAEKYADEVFDFEWIDDFSAARNAVMDRCSGKWYFTVDCDEWLDKDISELLAFLNRRKRVDFAFVIQRNYFSTELEKSDLYSDFRALRLVRLSTGQRYHSPIHESWTYTEPAERLTRTILHHDGYFLESPEAQKKKLQRNMKLLRQKLEKEPNDLRTLLQCIESGGADPDLIQYIKTSVALIQNKKGQWDIYGAGILHHAVEIARIREMPEKDEWIQLARRDFPDSIFTRVDVNFSAFLSAYDAGDWEKAIQYGEDYRKGIRLYRSPRLPAKLERDLVVGSPRSADENTERTVLLGLASSYLQDGQGEKALKALEDLDNDKLTEGQIRNKVVALSQLHAQTQLNVEQDISALYTQISEAGTDEKKRAVRLAAFHSIAAAAFAKEYQERERDYDGYWRPAYTVFHVLADQCEAGRAAAVMMSDNPEEMRALLAKVEDWQALPIEALEHALWAGVEFPLTENPVNMEIMDGLAARLASGENYAKQTTLDVSENEEYPDRKSLQWAQSLALASLRSFPWEQCRPEKSVSEIADAESETPSITPNESLSEEGRALIRHFAQIEATLLPQIYTSQMLTEENAAFLPPMHRWGFYCKMALDALDAGRPQEYLAVLRKGLKACPGEKSMVQFLLDRFMEDARPKASPELLALAERVRMILSAYDPDDPAVIAIRESPVYQQVAWIIEPEPVGQMMQ